MIEDQVGSSSNFSADPLLKMLDSFGPRQSDKISFVRSFAELISAEFQRQPDKGNYSSVRISVIFILILTLFRQRSKFSENPRQTIDMSE